ncbi:MAG: energy transducer TonB [Pseudomonadota bacterium]|nr:energy transducer TonB [Pseudomonadota bacterium]
MRDALVYSVLSHAVIMVIGYFGLPYIQREAVLTDTPIMVEIVNVSELTNAPPPKPEKKPPPKAEKKPPPPPKKPSQTAAPPPPPPAKDPEVAALPAEPKPQAKPKPKPKPEAKPKPKPIRKLAKAKPRRKPKPPDAFTSVLRTVEKLKNRPPPKENKKEDKKPEQKETFEQQMAQALMSRTARHDPLRSLAISEIDLVRQQIRECWSLPAGAKEAENLSIEIKMAMNPDGTVRQARILDQNRLQSDPFFRAAAESALRAVLNPHCNPLKLPPEKYQQWQNMILIFDPRDMF